MEAYSGLLYTTQLRQHLFLMSARFFSLLSFGYGGLFVVTRALHAFFGFPGSIRLCVINIIPTAVFRLLTDI